MLYITPLKTGKYSVAALKGIENGTVLQKHYKNKINEKKSLSEMMRTEDICYT